MSTRMRGAFVLVALVQAVERFAAFATLTLFVLFLQQHRGFSTDRSLLLFGSLQALSALSCLPGGVFSDRWLGPHLATWLGALLLLAGYSLLALDHPAGMWAALALLIAGQGCFRPGLQALVARHLAQDQAHRESIFLLLHFVLNVGTAAGPLVAEWTRARWGWPSVFSAATVSMVVVFAMLSPGAWRRRVAVPVETVPAASRVVSDRERRRACWFLAGLGIVLHLSAAQATSSLTLFAAENTVTRLSWAGRSVEVLPGHFLALHSILVLILLPLLLVLLRRLSRVGAEPSTPAKMVWGFMASAAAFAVMSWAGLRIDQAALHGAGIIQGGPGWLAGTYVLLTVGELLLWPMGLALVTSLAPAREVSRMVGLWFATIALGNALAGAFGLLWTRWPHHRYFAAVALLNLGAAAVLIVRLRWLERLLREGVEGRPR